MPGDEVANTREPEIPLQIATRPTGVRWLVFSLCCGSSWMLYVHRHAMGIIKPKLKDEWHLDEVQLGLLDSAFSSTYALCQFPAGIAADLLGPHLFLGSSILFWSLTMGLQGWAPTFGILWWIRIAFGAAQSGAYAAIARITKMWFPATIRTTVQGWIGVFFGRIGNVSVNLLLATLMIGWLGLSWQISVYVLAAAGIVLGILFLLLFRDWPARHPWTNAAEVALIAGDAPVKTSAPLKLREVLPRMRRRSVFNLLALNLQTSFSAAADSLYSAWIPLFLVDIYGLKFKEMGIYSSLPLLGGACGGILGGWLNDRWRRRSLRWGRAFVGMFGKGGAALLLLLAAFTLGRNPYWFCAALFAVKFVGDCSLPSTWGTVTDIGGDASASVFAWNNSVANSSMIVTPVVFGYIAKSYGWNAVLLFAAALYLLCAACWLVIDCTCPILAPVESTEDLAR